MTCIAAVTDGKTVTIGGDSAGVAGLGMQIRADEKVFVNGPFVMGFTSSFRMGQLLRYKFTPPAWDENDSDVHKFMCTKFVDSLRTCLADGGFRRKKDEAEYGGCFLVGYRGGIFYIDTDFQVGTLRDDFAAVGCGEDVALGAMHALPEAEPNDRVLAGLRAAHRFSAGVRPPFEVVVGGASQ